MHISRRQFALMPLILALPAVYGALYGCGSGGSSSSAQAVPTPTPTASTGLDPSVGAAYAGRMSFGAAITPDQLRIPATAEFIRHHFRVLVAENVMKQSSLSPKAEGQYEFADADAIVNFGMTNGMKVRGHTLVWYSQMAPWILKENGGEVTRATLIARLERYITDVVTHFKGRVYAWDVVNEAFQFDEPGATTDANGMRMSDFRRIIGPEYIEIAFRAAAKADPDALLFYNDYETQSTRKVAAIIAMVKDLKAKGVKIDGIGHQSHCARAWPRVADVEAAIDAFAALGVTQHVTELDITLNQNVTDTLVTAATPELLNAQAERYRELMTLYMRKRQQVTAVLVWGIGDAYTWLTSWPTKRFEAPLLFDTQLKAKPAYAAVMDVARAP
jgi:endo-1,4-beta-xylanase